ncbi:MAG TPA: nucleoside 2-deoxyribosyltransferase [Thermomicrobiales bacterium]|nr:nucleoside 2-deoxyribosyltransferase [Thermomicrobiales bacterium]
MSHKSIYLASPLGFADSTRGFMADLVALLSAHVDVVNPWEKGVFDAEFASLATENDWSRRVARLHEIDLELGRLNTASIDGVDGVFAVLDGVDVDSGTAAEIGYAFAKGKYVAGLRTDFRLAGDNDGSIVNLQVEYFIEASGGRIVRTADALAGLAREYAGR